MAPIRFSVPIARLVITSWAMAEESQPISETRAPDQGRRTRSGPVPTAKSPRRATDIQVKKVRRSAFDGKDSQWKSADAPLRCVSRAESWLRAGVTQP